MRKQGFLETQTETIVQLSESAPQSTMSLTIPPVTTIGHPPKQNPQPTKRKTKIGFLTLKDQGYSKKKTSTDAKGESETERSVPAGTLVKPKPSTASLDSRKSIDSKKGQLQTTTIAQPIDSSDSGASHTHMSSLPISYLSSSQKDNISSKGLVVLVGDNTPIADTTPLVTDPDHLSSITALVVNVSSLSHDEIQATFSVSNDPSATTQAGDDEETKSTTFHAYIKGEKSDNCAYCDICDDATIKGEKVMMLPEMLIISCHIRAQIFRASTALTGGSFCGFMAEEGKTSLMFSESSTV